MAAPPPSPPPPPPLDPQLQTMADGSATSGAGEEHHHHGPGDEPSVRIEDLPTEILHAIVSLLPLKEAVRTSIVSTSWKMLWTFHCNLCFYGPNERDHDPSTSMPRLESYGPAAFAKLKIKRDKFIEDVNCVIQRHSGVGVSKFSIRCGLHKEDFDHLDRWISFAALSRAKIVDFDLKKNGFRSKEDNLFPLEALIVQGSPSCVESLYLADASIKPHSGIRGVTVLRRLVLEIIEISGDFSGFLANCSALEDLEMIRCSGVTNLSIPHQLDKLQHLLIDGMDVETVESHAANLARFEYKGKEIPIILHARSKLEKATIMFKSSNGLARIFTAVPIILRVKMLKVEALILFEQLDKLTPRPDHIFIHLRHMTCEIAFISNYLPSSSVLQLARYLDVAPQLETLDLDMLYLDSNSMVWVHDDLVEGEGPHMRRHDHLKTVYISGFRCYAGQTKLACCILENACVLEHMRIQPRFGTRRVGDDSRLNKDVRGRFLPEAREWAQVTSERFGKAITVLDEPSE